MNTAEIDSNNPQRKPEKTLSEKTIVKLPEERRIATTDPLVAKWIELLVTRNNTKDPIVSRQELLGICPIDGKPNDPDSLSRRATRTNDAARTILRRVGFTIETIEKANQWTKDKDNNGSYRFSKLEQEQPRAQTEEDQAQPDFQPNKHTDPYGLFDGTDSFRNFLMKLRQESTSSPERKSPKDEDHS